MRDANVALLKVRAGRGCPLRELRSAGPGRGVRTHRLDTDGLRLLADVDEFTALAAFLLAQP